jgi:hypothetical protein
VAAAVESGAGSSVTSTVGKVDGAGSVINSCITGGSVVAGAGGVVSSTGSGTATGTGPVAAVSAATSGAIGCGKSVTWGVSVDGVGYICGQGEGGGLGQGEG